MRKNIFGSRMLKLRFSNIPPACFELLGDGNEIGRKYVLPKQVDNLVRTIDRAIATGEYFGGFEITSEAQAQLQQYRNNLFHKKQERLENV